MRQVNEIIVHCSASDWPKHDNVQTIMEWHKEKGFNGIGYHYFIDSRGAVFQGRDLAKAGAHCYGRNKSTVGICLSGDRHFSLGQIKSLLKLRESLKNIFPALRTEANILTPHNRYNEKKECPRIDVYPLHHLQATDIDAYVDETDNVLMMAVMNFVNLNKILHEIRPKG